MSAPDKPEGLRGKYHGLRRTDDDSEVEGWYFVLRETDPHTPDTLRAYARAVKGENPTLHRELMVQAGLIASAQSAGLSIDEFETAYYFSQWER